MRFLTIIFLLCVVGLAQAQQSEPEERWWWAYRASTGEVLAYNGDGEVNVILDDVEGYEGFYKAFPFRNAIDITPDTILAVARVQGEFGLYKLSYDSAALLETLSDLNETTDDSYAYQFIVADAPYVVMTHLLTSTVNLYVYNIENGAVFSFPIYQKFHPYCPEYRYVEAMRDCFGISSREHVIRYVEDAPLDEENVDWVLRELNLITGETRILFRQNLPQLRKYSVGCKPDKPGTQWLCYSHEEVPEEHGYSLSYYIIRADGSVQTLLEDADEQLQYHMDAGFGYDNEIIFIDARNDPTFKFDIYALNQRQPETIVVNSEYFIPILFNTMRRFANGRIMLNGFGYYFLIETDGRVAYMGKSFCCHLREPISSDYRWIITTSQVEDDWEWWLWDTQEGRQLFEISGIEVYGRTNFTDYGLIIGKEWVYRYTDAAPLSLPAELDGEYHDVLPDGTLLYYQPQAAELREAGIYRYNPDTDDTNLLVADAAPIYILKE